MLYDVIIVGGGFAGLSAALQLSRTRRKVLVLDAGQPRNRFAAHSHGVLGHDGKPGSQLLAEARQQVLAYPHTQMFSGTVSGVQRGDAGFVVELDGGARWFTGRRLLLATGVADVLPDVPGLQERWGHTVFHCPYCHGYEVGGGPMGVLGTVHQALLLADWGDITLFTQGTLPVTDEEAAMLARRKVRVEAVPVVALEGAAPALEGALLQDGRSVPLKAMLVATQPRASGPLAAALGCVSDDTPMGAVLRTDSWKLTTVAGIYAAGDLARAPNNITFAMADGVAAAVGAHASLMMEEAHGAA